jgi:hypothetical protein
MRLLADQGLAVPTEPVAARRTWEWLWQRNPAVRDGGGRLPPGWVLERDEEIVGFYGNIPMRYHFGGRPLLAAVASSWAIQTAFRSRARDLASAYFAQERPDLLLATTANRAVGRIWSRFSAATMPQADYQRLLYWILDGGGFVRSALRKKDVGAGPAAAAGLVLSPVVSAALALGRRRPGRLRRGLEPETIAWGQVGDEFDALWRRKLGEDRRLYACRAAEDLRWHFEPGAEAGTAAVIGCCRQSRLDGYLVLVRAEAPEIGLVRGRIADLLVAGNDPEVVDALLAAGYEWGRQHGFHVLELMGLPRQIRSLVERSRPFSRLLPTHPFLYKATTRDLAEALHGEGAWYPSTYDGDSTLV